MAYGEEFYTQVLNLTSSQSHYIHAQQTWRLMFVVFLPFSLQNSHKIIPNNAVEKGVKKCLLSSPTVPTTSKQRGITKFGLLRTCSHTFAVLFLICPQNINSVIASQS
ncbi:CLUMA_CG000791, isoform A [Clunio marinus]|uniref:CLUMA_CG000791, isoform A n=1 Tax=Clunio marinus TaxID=568069 RepID=A0A1J1HHE5_9DIPT|nr:CLUMA_CG000791, isoform A [Clunio marinus]